MKQLWRIEQYIAGVDKHKLFLIGFYVSFLIVMTLAMLLDFAIGNDIDAYIEIFFIFLAALGFIHYYITQNMTVAVYAIVIIATLTTYALLISNHFNISIFHTIVPLGYFLLFSLKRSLVYTFIHQMIVISIYMYAYIHYPENTLLHDPAILVAIVMASLMIILFGIVYHISVENSYRQIERANRQQTLLLKEVHHRVKNNLNLISSMLGLQMLREENEEIRYIFEKNKFRIKSIALVHEILYMHNDFEKINIYEYLNRLSDALCRMFEKHVSVEIEGDVRDLPFELVLKLGIISNELIVNSMKYAFNNGMPPQIHIGFFEEEGCYVYRYGDSGTGVFETESLKSKKSLGLRLIEMMAQQMDTVMEVEGKNGLNYRMEVPKDVS